MASMDVSLKEMMTIDGSIGAVIVDHGSGMALGALGGSKDLDLQVAAAGNTEVVKAKLRTMDSLGLKDSIEDILITLHTQYHLIRPLVSNDALFIYLVLDKSRGNLAMARHQLAGVEKELAI